MTSKAILSKEVRDELTELFNKKYASYRKEKTFALSAHTDGTTAEVEVLLKNDSETFYYPIKGKLNLEKEEMNAEEAARFLVDYIDLYLEEYFLEDENAFIPIDWSPYQYEAVDFELCGQVQNRKAERMADEMLALDDAANTTAIN